MPAKRLDSKAAAVKGRVLTQKCRILLEKHNSVKKVSANSTILSPLKTHNMLCQYVPCTSYTVSRLQY